MLCAGTAFLLAAVPAAAGPDYPITPVGFTKVRVTGGLWAARLETNRTATLPANFHKCEETGRIANFEKAAGLKEGKHEGIFFDDSDVYKVMEGAAYTLALHADPELDAYMDRFIATVAQAQEDDGYLYTARTIDPEKPAHGAGKERWADIKNAHELYCMGHMIEAAVAHHQATGKRNFLDVAVKCADMLDRTFGPDKRRRHGAPRAGAGAGAPLPLHRRAALSGPREVLRGPAGRRRAPRAVRPLLPGPHALPPADGGRGPRRARGLFLLRRGGRGGPHGRDRLHPDH